MARNACFFFVNGLIILVLFSAVNFAGSSVKIKEQEENHAPVVKILAPKNRSIYKPDTQINYAITVSDQEDGESKFQEIESNEVLMQVKYLSDSSKLSDELSDEAKNNSIGLTAMRTSNCLNCHAFNSKLIGPSFYEINKRYRYTKANTERLEKSIIEGLTGVWGKAIMPTHPELTKGEVSEMVEWIFKNGADSSVSYYRGTEGSFRIKSPVASETKGILMVIASYVDHGLNDKPKTNLTGQDVIILSVK